jgi:hypothetical protein
MARAIQVHSHAPSDNETTKLSSDILSNLYLTKGPTLTRKSKNNESRSRTTAITVIDV